MASAATTSHSQNANQRRNTYVINKPGQLNEPNQQVSSFQSQSSTSQQHMQHQHRSKQQQQHRLDQNNNYLGMSNNNHHHQQQQQHQQQMGHNSTQYHKQNTFYLKQQQQMYNSNDQYNSHAAKSTLMYRNVGNSRTSAGTVTIEALTLHTLVWAKLNNFPWWPCKIVCDSNSEFSKIIDNTQMYFIEFFGPLKERAWLSCHSIFRYKGIESFKIYAQDQVDRATSKAAKEKLAERFQLKVALNRRDQWEVAIEQADMYLKTSEAVHDVNSAHSKVEKSGRAANLAYSLARLSQLNEEKINAKNASFNQPKRKRDQQHQEQMQQQLQHQQQYTKKSSQDEFFSGHELSIQKQYLEEQSLKYKKQKKLQKNLQQSQMSNEHKQQQNEQHNQQQFHSIESIRHERPYTTNAQYTSYATGMDNNANQLASTTESQCLQDIYNSKQLSKKKNQMQQQQQQQQEELTSNHENQNEDSDQQSQNSGSSSDEDNDSLFQPTSIFEYDIEQPNQMLATSAGNCADVSMNNNGYQIDQGDMAHQSINSIVNEIKNNSKMNKGNYNEDIASQEYSIINNFITTDSEEEEKIDKNDTEWRNTSFKSAKRKSGHKLGTKKTSKYNAQQKAMFYQDANNSKKLFDPKLQQQQTHMQSQTGVSPVKKKRGRKPKYASNEASTFANDENKTQYLQQQQQHQHGSIESQQQQQQQQQQSMYIQNDGQKMYQKICVSSNNSSRRTSDTSGTLSATSEDEVFESKSGDLNKHHNLVLMEDNSVLNQSEINKICKKSMKMKATATKPKSQAKKRNSKSTSSITGSITGLSEFSTMEQINQMAELDYNQFVDENSTNLTNMQHQQHGTSGQNNTDNAGSIATTTTEQNPATTNSTNTAETYLIDRYKYAVRHIRQGLSVEEACNKYRISKGALLKCLSGGTAPRGKKTRLTESEENEIVEWLINNKDLKYNEAIHLVFEQVEKIFELAQRPNPFNNGKPSMDWWYDFLSRHPQIMASKPDWLMRGKVNDQYIKDVQSGQLKCTKFRRALLSAIQYIRSLNDAQAIASSSTQASSSSSSSSICNRSPSSNNNSNKTQLSNSANSSFKIAPGLSNRIEKNDMAKTIVAAGPRQNKMAGQKSTSYKSSLLKQQRKSSVVMSGNKMASGSDQMEIKNIKEELDEQVPSPTSLDTRIFNADNVNNSTNSSGATGANSSANSNNINYFNISHRQKSMLSETARPIKNEKSIQDSLEYLYEQNNNFINEISNINQLMDGKNNSSTDDSGTQVSSSVGGACVSDTAQSTDNSNQKNQFYDANKQVENSFDNFLDQALNSSSHQDNFDDLMESKIVDTSSLPMGIGNSNILASPASNLNVNGSTCSSIIEDLVSGVNDSGYVNQSFNSAGDENYFQPGFNQTNYFNSVPTSQVFTDLHKKPSTSSGKQQQNELNSTFFLNNINENNLLLNSQCGFENFTQSQPFNTKLDFTPKNHLLVQDDDDDNDDDIELVNSILSNNNDENLEDNDSMNIVNAIDPSGFLP